MPRTGILRRRSYWDADAGMGLTLMPFEKINLSNFQKGVSTAFGRLAQPQRTMTRLSNLAFYRNENGIGSLSTFGGSVVASTLASGPQQAPFYYIASYAPESGIGGFPASYAVQVTAGGGSGTNIVNVSNPTWGPAVINVNAQTSFLTPQAFMFQDDLVILTGFNNPPALFNGTTVSSVTNAWTAAGFVPSWLASFAVAVGNFVQPSTPNGHFYQAIQGGTTGSSEPTWPTGTDSTVPDGQVIWQEAGSTTANVPNAAHGVYHQGALWLWGTAAVSSNDGVVGPSALAASDVGNANSWNVANRTFVGSGDGQVAQGCAVMSVEEVGISPEARLVLFKDFSVYEFLGNFPNFSLVQAKTDMGCQTARSIRYVPQLGGIIRFTDRGFALYTGPGAQADSVISTDIDAYIFGRSEPTGQAIVGVDRSKRQLGQSALTKDAYFCAMPLTGGNGQLTRLFILDLNLKVWTVCDIGFGAFPITSLNDIRDYGGGTTVLATQISGSGGPTVLNAFQGNSPQWNFFNGQSTEIIWACTTPLIVDPKKPQRVFYTRNVLVGGISPNSSNGGSTLGLGRITAASIIYNNPATGSDNLVNGAGTPQQSGSGTPQSKALPIPPGGLSLPARINIGIKTRGFQLVLAGKGISIIESFDFEVVPREERPYAQI